MCADPLLLGISGIFFNYTSSKRLDAVGYDLAISWQGLHQKIFALPDRHLKSFINRYSCLHELQLTGQHRLGEDAYDRLSHALEGLHFLLNRAAHACAL